MKKYKKIVYLFLIFVIFALCVVVYANIKDEQKENPKEKALAEVKYLESELSAIINEMNNIDTRNYSISISQIPEQDKKQNSSDSSSESDSNSSEKNSDSGSDSDKQQTDSKQEVNEKYNMKPTGVLLNTKDINWENIKSEVEVLYSSIPTITLDLYQFGTNQDETLGFNQEFDNLTKMVKEENKEKTLSELSKLYDYIPKFIAKVTDDELEKTIVETKASLFRAYSKLDSKNWAEIENDTNQTISSYEKVLANTNIETEKQYSISKVYVMLNELKNAVKIQDETVFLIKYKNILEEINNL